MTRRRLLAGSAALVAGTSVQAQPASRPRPLAVAQIIDTSPAQQDVSKDFLIGARAAWQELNARGGVRGRPVQHLVLETDGSPASLRQAIDQARDNPAVATLAGTAGDRAAVGVAAALRSADGLAHLAPWLNGALAADERTVPIFAGRQEQIAHALRSLSGMGVPELGAVYATEDDWRLSRLDVEGTAAALRLQLKVFRAGGDLTGIGQRLTPQTPAVLLFLGGTPELLGLLQGLQRQQRQRYVVALADVNLQTLAQLGGGRTMPVIVTQPVPLVSAPIPVVRDYRDTLARLFDEAPSALSLAGFISVRYTALVLADTDQPGRAAVLASVQRRVARDIGGFLAGAQDRRTAYVTQTMLTADGRLVG